MSEADKSKKEEYRVLARKYRPQNFEELIGQEALVRTLSNAIESGRIAHAFMLTGVRGVGKTTTARIIAKALNYKGADGTSGPTTGDTADCKLCKAISEDRHPDVIEMDAASRTGVEDVREILDGVRYAPTEARYKIYIIDEVHMLSKNAFNALLKTLEEPPPHVKFIFATTEIRKVPITVLSRCQRFDLRRVDVPTLSAHFSSICDQEGMAAEEAAITLIARAADGSVRDGLSILDRAISLAGEGGITASLVEGMLGLVDRARNLDLLDFALAGAMADALQVMDDLYSNGADALQVMQDLLDLTHQLTRLRAVPEMKNSIGALGPDEAARMAEMAAKLSMPSLSKAWQMLLKGLAEVQAAPNPQAAAEMAVIRLIYAADLPDPADLLKRLKDGSGSVGAGGGAVSPQGAGAGGTVAQMPQRAMSGNGGEWLGGMAETAVKLSVVPDAPQPVTAIHSLPDMVAMLEQEKEMILAGHVYQFVHLVKLENRGENARLEIALAENAPQKLSQELAAALKRITAQHWMVSIVSAAGQPTMAQQDSVAAEAERATVLALPVMKDIFAVFPEAELVSIDTLPEERS
ncbi:MAG: DNA polymerase III subunit gamma/tau [Micavibrio sp.]|nr:DNA polymerase III subunit gamma/tau [Micavibrio sp.]